MTWLLLAGATAVLYAAQGGWTKRITRFVSSPVATWALFAFSLPLLAVYLALDGIPPSTPRFWLVVVVNAALYVLSFSLYVSAIERGELGIVYPLLAITPIFVVPVEWLLLGDPATPRGAGGIILIAVGVYLLNFDAREASLLAPLRAIARDSGARRMVAVALIWSVSGTLDRVAVLEASPALYGVSLSVLLSLALLPLAIRTGRTEEGEGGKEETSFDAGPARPLGLRRALADRPLSLLLQGALFGAMFVVQMEALLLSLAAYVIAIKRSGALLSVLMGATFFGEGGTRHRLAGTAVILCGVYLVAST